MTSTKYFVREDQALFIQISLFSLKIKENYPCSEAYLNTNLPNWIISCPDSCYSGAVKVFPQNWPDEDKCDDKSKNGHVNSFP